MSDPYFCWERTCNISLSMCFYFKLSTYLIEEALLSNYYIHTWGVLPFSSRFISFTVAIILFRQKLEDI